jgi:hypothetical protein
MENRNRSGKVEKVLTEAEQKQKQSKMNNGVYTKLKCWLQSEQRRHVWKVKKQ